MLLTLPYNCDSSVFGFYYFHDTATIEINPFYLIHHDSPIGFLLFDSRHNKWRREFVSTPLISEKGREMNIFHSSSGLPK